MSEPRTKAGKAANADTFHGFGCVVGSDEGPDYCGCGLSDRILAIEAEAATGEAEGLRLDGDERLTEEEERQLREVVSRMMRDNPEKGVIDVPWVAGLLGNLDAVRAATGEAEGLDVERLARALDDYEVRYFSVDPHGETFGSPLDAARAIAARYAALAADPGRDAGLDVERLARLWREEEVTDLDVDCPKVDYRATAAAVMDRLVDGPRWTQRARYEYDPDQPDPDVLRPFAEAIDKVLREGAIEGSQMAGTLLAGRWVPPTPILEALDLIPGLPCPYRSSLTDEPCVLPWGHLGDSPTRFHRFAVRLSATEEQR